MPLIGSNLTFIRAKRKAGLIVFSHDCLQFSQGDGKVMVAAGLQQVVYGRPASFIQGQTNFLRFMSEYEAQEFTDVDLSLLHADHYTRLGQLRAIGSSARLGALVLTAAHVGKRVAREMLNQLCPLAAYMYACCVCYRCDE
jgi:hypothetical protein